MAQTVSAKQHCISFFSGLFTGKRISIKLPETLESIGKHAFRDNYNLTRVYIPSKVSFIGAYAFKDCDELIIQCEKGSYAQRYADENNIEYELI